jgi:hypothetical protein
MYLLECSAVNPTHIENEGNKAKHNLLHIQQYLHVFHLTLHF